MKKLTKSLLMIAFISIGYQGFSQSVGIKGGLNLSNMLWKDKYHTYSEESEIKPGFHIGVVAEFPLSYYTKFEPGLMYSTKGTKEEEIFVGYTLESSIQLNYLDIPLNFKVGQDFRGTKVFALAGPYIGMGLSGKMEIKNKTTKREYSEDVEWDAEETEGNFRRLDFGFGLGGGFELRDFGLQFYYALGLANISSYTENETRRANRNFQMSAFYFFRR